jgi:UDP-N-acetylmuramate--alanine ligase
MKYKVKAIHFVGIGGVGMSGIAEVLINLGFKVSGSDVNETTATLRLATLGAKINIGHKAANLTGADVLVISSAIDLENPEILRARELAIPVIPRAMMLSELMRFRQGIAVAGTHGKTTTTSLIASVLASAKMDPTYVIGGKLESVGSNAKLGSGEFIVAEADESDGSFLHLNPVISVVTNIDRDHLESYSHDFENLKQAFLEFISRVPFYGCAVVCLDDLHVKTVIANSTKRLITYGLDVEAHIRAFDIRCDGKNMLFRVSRSLDSHFSNASELDIKLGCLGEHNVLNALAAIGVATELGIDDEHIIDGLKNFLGVGRRLQSYGVQTFKNKHFLLIDDYGHHPNEIAPTLRAIRMAHEGRRLVLIFQPHRYSRTRDCFEDFVSELSNVDVLILSEVYSAGEQPVAAADGRSLARGIRMLGRVEPIFVPELGNVPSILEELVENGDVVVTMGAGSIGGLPQKIIEAGNDAP